MTSIYTSDDNLANSNSQYFYGWANSSSSFRRCDAFNKCLMFYWKAKLIATYCILWTIESDHSWQDEHYRYCDTVPAHCANRIDVFSSLDFGSIFFTLHELYRKWLNFEWFMPIAKRYAYLFPLSQSYVNNCTDVFRMKKKNIPTDWPKIITIINMQLCSAHGLNEYNSFFYVQCDCYIFYLPNQFQCLNKIQSMNLFAVQKIFV